MELKLLSPREDPPLPERESTLKVELFDSITLNLELNDKEEETEEDEEETEEDEGDEVEDEVVIEVDEVVSSPIHDLLINF
jgi:ribosome recycling factor